MRRRRSRTRPRSGGSRRRTPELPPRFPDCSSPPTLAPDRKSHIYCSSCAGWFRADGDTGSLIVCLGCELIIGPLVDLTRDEVVELPPKYVKVLGQPWPDQAVLIRWAREITGHLPGLRVSGPANSRQRQ